MNTFSLTKKDNDFSLNKNDTFIGKDNDFSFKKNDAFIGENNNFSLNKNDTIIKEDNVKIYTGGEYRMVGGWSEYELNNRHYNISKYIPSKYYDKETINKDDVFKSVIKNLHTDPLIDSSKRLAKLIQKINNIPNDTEISYIHNNFNEKDVENIINITNSTELVQFANDIFQYLNKYIKDKNIEIDIPKIDLNYSILDNDESLTENINISNKNNVILLETNSKKELRNLEIIRGLIAQQFDFYYDLLYDDISLYE